VTGRPGQGVTVAGVWCRAPCGARYPAPLWGCGWGWRNPRPVGDRIRVSGSSAGPDDTVAGGSASVGRSDNRRWRPCVQRSGVLWVRTLCSRYGAVAPPVMDSARRKRSRPRGWGAKSGYFGRMTWVNRLPGHSFGASAGHRAAHPLSWPRR
jgi:hypothetical protein